MSTAEQATASDAAADYELQRIGSDDWEAFRDVRLRSLADERGVQFAIRLGARC